MEKMEKLINKLDENNKSIHIARVPKKAKQSFIELANEEFESDYGMALKFLVDGLINRDLHEVIEKLVELEQRVQELEHKKEEPVDNTKKIVMCDGTIKRIGGKR